MLEATVQATREHPDPAIGVDQERINAILGRDSRDPATAHTLDHLIRSGYLIEGPMRRTFGTGPGPATVLLGEKALIAIAGWPSTSGEALLGSLLAELDRRIEIAEPDERSKLERFRDFAVGAGRDVLVGVLTAQAQKYTL